MLAGLRAKADTLPDPNALITDPTCTNDTVVPSGETPCPNKQTSTSFVFNADSVGGGIIEFTNLSGVDWKKLLFVVNTPLFINCASDSFTFCGFNVVNGSTELLFSTSNKDGQGNIIPWLADTGTGNNGGITNKNVFSINLNGSTLEQLGTTTDGGGWLDPSGNPLQISTFANVTAPPQVPEPATMTLMALGIGALVSRRRK